MWAQAKTGKVHKIHPLRVTKFIEPHLAQEVPELKTAGGVKSTGGSTTCLLCSDSPLGVQLKPPLEAGYTGLHEPLICSDRAMPTFSPLCKDSQVPRKNNETDLQDTR